MCVLEFIKKSLRLPMQLCLTGNSHPVSCTDCVHRSQLNGYSGAQVLIRVQILVTIREALGVGQLQVSGYSNNRMSLSYHIDLSYYISPVQKTAGEYDSPNLGDLIRLEHVGLEKSEQFSVGPHVKPTVKILDHTVIIRLILRLIN